jgi:hypothetical protein
MTFTPSSSLTGRKLVGVLCVLLKLKRDKVHTIAIMIKHSPTH